MVGWLINASVAYWIGRTRPPGALPVVGRERFDRLERMVERGGVILLLAMRLIPIVPFSLFSIRRRRRPGAGRALHVDDRRSATCR